jgi:xanthine phosphoribosyltransferase
MELLKNRIAAEGKILGNGILKVDSLINHQVDPMLMDACGVEFARLFKDTGATRILTAEISGIAPALMAGIHLKLPVVYARKSRPVTMPGNVYLTTAPSHTKGNMVDLIVSPEFLKPGENVLIIDDFLASGATIFGLIRLAEAAGAKVVGVGALIEKTFEGGRAALEKLNIPVETLVQITSMENNELHFSK